MLSKTIRSINIIGMSISQTNISMKHRRKHGIGILNQDKSVNIINMSKSQIDITSKHASKALNVQSRNEHPLIVQSNATSASL